MSSETDTENNTKWWRSDLNNEDYAKIRKIYKKYKKRELITKLGFKKRKQKEV